MIARLVDRIRKHRYGQTIISVVVPLLIAVVTAVDSVVAVDNLAILTNVDRFFSDWAIASFTPPEPQDPEIVIVAIDESTLQQLPTRSPIDRQFLAELLSTIVARKPRAIGVDLLFDQPTDPIKDELLHRTLTSIEVPLVVGYTDLPEIVTDRQQAFLNDYVPLKLRGLVTLATDQFDVVRWVYPGKAETDARYTRGFASALAAALGAATPREQIEIAWRGQPARGAAAFKQYPAQFVKLLPEEWFENKIVLIGTDITLTDRHRTPFMTVRSRGEGNLPGIVIQAYGLSQLLHERKAPFLGWRVDLLISLTCGAAGAWLGLGSQPLLLRAFGEVVFIVLLWAGGVASFYYGGALIGPIAPTLSMSASFWAMEVLKGREARRQREFIRGAFSRYVSPKVVDQLIQDPQKMSSEGERRIMSYLFTDIANFTTVSEVLESRELAKLLNAYLDGLTTAVLKHDGMVDKFIGDAVFAIFNAPLEQPDHAERAVRCALDIDRFAEAFRAKQNAANIDFGLTRIGVHTGPAIIGNFGSRLRVEYTAQGDAVNTASRLEGVNKYFGTRICVSEATRALCSGIVFRPIASVALKGKLTAVDLWEPLHGDDTRGEFLMRYGEAFTKLKESAPEALELFAALEAEDPSDPCVEFHLKRLRQGQSGVAIVMTEK
jgi:adenylate cyclase